MIIGNPTKKKEIEPIVPSPVTPKEEPVDSAVINSQYTEMSSLLVYMEGSSWTVDYHRQLLGAEDEAAPFTDWSDAPYQQYEKIQQAELKVTSPLTQSQEEGTGNFIVEGTSTMYPGTKPNLNDIFIAHVGDGRQALFLVTQVSRKTILKASAYEISYRLYQYADSDKLDELNEKVVKTLIFDKSYLGRGQNPYLRPETHQQHTELEADITQWSRWWLRVFYDKQYRTIVVPDKIKAHDPFIVNYMLNTLEAERLLDIKLPQRKNVEGNGHMSYPTLWDLLVAMRWDHIDIIHPQIRWVSVGEFPTIPVMGGIAYSGLKEVCHIRDLTTYCEEESHRSAPELVELVSDAPNPDTAKPSHYSAGIVDAYVFSANFYLARPESMSQIEWLTFEMLHNKAIDIEMVNELFNQFPDWETIDQFYYLPILTTLARYVLRRD
ncbi:hypothetical protein [Endozoicomonas sp. ONNA1]|uniref:hypothetical protein n=1 Tax=Endozoicomonas sp. ONNA1 TaxID=2828740 RepID=UPI0021484907|nr:hypothetical protein [Endozoicomonas sp. ONNA1]